MTEERLRELEALEQAATRGPWEVQDASNPDEDEPCYRGIRGWTDESSDGTYLKLSVDDAAFVAESRTALPELIAEVRRLQAEQTFVRSMLDSVEEGCVSPAEFYARIARATTEDIRALYDTIRRVDDAHGD